MGTNQKNQKGDPCFTCEKGVLEEGAILLFVGEREKESYAVEVPCYKCTVCKAVFTEEEMMDAVYAKIFKIDGKNPERIIKIPVYKFEE